MSAGHAPEERARARRVHLFHRRREREKSRRRLRPDRAIGVMSPVFTPVRCARERGPTACPRRARPCRSSTFDEAVGGVRRQQQMVDANALCCAARRPPDNPRTYRGPASSVVARKASERPRFRSVRKRARVCGRNSASPIQAAGRRNRAPSGSHCNRRPEPAAPPAARSVRAWAMRRSIKASL